MMVAPKAALKTIERQLVIRNRMEGWPLTVEQVASWAQDVFGNLFPNADAPDAAEVARVVRRLGRSATKFDMERRTVEVDGDALVDVERLPHRLGVR